jgi:hypothetical protein
MGVQSVDEEYKRKTLLRMEKDDHLRRSLVALREAGLEAKLDHILGLPGEPRAAQEQARELYVEFSPRRVQTFWLSYLPGIDLTKQALAEGILTPADLHEIDRGKARIFRHPHLEGRANSDAEFYQRYDLLFRALPFFPRVLQRRLRIKHFPRLSEKVASAVGFLFDLANAVRRLDGETLIFARHYARQSLAQLPELLFGRFLPTRRPAVRSPIASGGKPRTRHLPVRLGV